MKPIRLITQDGTDPNQVLNTVQTMANLTFVGTPVEILSINVSTIFTPSNTFYFKAVALLQAPTDEDWAEFDKLLKKAQPQEPGRIVKL
jgi:hypothetical protein